MLLILNNPIDPWLLPESALLNRLDPEFPPENKEPETSGLFLFTKASKGEFCLSLPIVDDDIVPKIEFCLSVPIVDDDKIPKREFCLSVVGLVDEFKRDEEFAARFLKNEFELEFNGLFSLLIGLKFC